MNRFFHTALLLTLLSAGTSSAQTTYHWLNTSGGSYHTAGNWTPAGGPPLVNDTARFSLSQTYNVTFTNVGTQSRQFEVRGGNVTFQYFGATAQHFWHGSGTNIVGPQAGDSATSATLNLTSMFNNPMMGHHLIVGNTAGKTGTMNIHGNGWWKGYSSSDVTVGSAGTGNLNVTTVGILQKSILEANNITFGGGGTGNGTVSGLNASMTANNVLSVGSAPDGLGTLTISNQGKVNVADSLFVGANSFNDNKVTVSGSGSELVLGNDTMQIGFGGKGTLRVENGGKVTNSNGSSMSIGSPAGSQGLLQVTGANSHFLSTGTQAISVGSSGSGQVSVTNGGLLEVANMRLGQQASGSGSLVVDGNGSLVNLHGSDSNFIGQSGTGQLTVSNGAVLSSSGGLFAGTNNVGTIDVTSGGKIYAESGRVGVGSVAGSKATIDGSGSLWSMTGGVDVGWSSTAEMFVTNGGQVITNGGRLGVSNEGHGIANLQGAGTHWNTSGPGEFVLGQSGQGTLSISQGALMSSRGVTFGSEADGNGAALVTGAGSQWSVSDGMALGYSGHGNLNLTNSGKLAMGNNAWLRLGHQANATGNLNISGNGSQVTLGSGGLLTVGLLGSGNVSVTGGGKIEGGTGTIASGLGSSGSVLVRNANTQWNMADNLTVGLGGQGNLTIDNGGSVTAAQVFVGQNGGSTGEIRLAGANSSLTTTGNITLGGSSLADGGSGLLAIGSGSTVNVGNQLSLWSQGRLELDGGRLVLTGLNNQGGQFDWQRGTVEFRNNTVLNDGLLDTILGTSHTLSNFQTLTTGATGGLVVAPGHFTVDGGKVTGNNFTNIGTTAVVRGSMQMNGNFLNDIAGTFVVGGTGQVSFQGTAQNNGMFILDGAAAKSSGGTFTNNGTVTGKGRLDHQFLNNGVVAVDAGNLMTVTGGINHGHIQIAGGRLNVTGQIINEPTGLITGHGVLGTSTSSPGGIGLFNNGIIAVSGNNFDIHGDVRNTSSGRIITSGNATTTFWDDVEHNGAEIRTSLGSSTVFYGSVTGAAPYTGLGSVFFEGDLKPGNSPANVLFEGDLYFGNTATLTMELGGLFAGADYDRLSVFGDIYLNGELYVDLINGFKPKFGDEFLLIDNRGLNSIFGQFTGLDHGSIFNSSGQQFLVSYQAGSSGRGFALTAVPEPSTGLLVLVVACIAALYGRQSRPHVVCQE
jgi:T5SS/PEP-CTERM-associated repeat protein